MKVFVHPVAEHDLHEAAAFYEREGSPALAARFIADFKRLAKLVVEHPEIGSPRSRGRRGFSFSISVFPYTVIYRASADEIRILIVKHDSKRPGYGDKRT